LVSTAKQWLAEARSVAVLTGAGVSAESGVPTFRGEGGLWRQYRPEDLATPEAFARDPRLVSEWYDWRRARIAACQPNAGHFALVRLEQSKLDFLLITQNVDGLHERAGSRKITRLHGSIWRTRCLNCSEERDDFRVPWSELPPRCACGGILRPAVVWFGEMLPEAAWAAATEAARRCDVFLVAGTSAAVYPAASLAPLARRHGARVVEVNVEETPLSSSAEAALRGPSARILDEIIA
jgi:NAD-dependent deacetylase